MEIIKNDKIFFCEKCNYLTSKKYHFDRHLLTSKHKKGQNGNDFTDKKGTNEKKGQHHFSCKCGKIFKTNSGLWKHEKRCNYIKKEIIVEQKILENREKKDELKSLIIDIMTDSNKKMNILMKENQELRKQVTQLIPRVGNNNNNLKQKFNINVFLNEKCKDALSMDDFIDKIEISMKNLLTTKEKGNVHGISNIIMENMNKLSLYERPLHCTDKKKETLYIKNNQWEKDENKEYISKALKKLEKKQLKNIKLWIDKHPNYMNDDKEQEEFAEILRECGKSIDDNRNKIVKNLCNEVFVNKDEIINNKI